MSTGQVKDVGNRFLEVKHLLLRYTRLRDLLLRLVLPGIDSRSPSEFQSSTRQESGLHEQTLADQFQQVLD